MCGEYAYKCKYKIEFYVILLQKRFETLIYFTTWTTLPRQEFIQPRNVEDLHSRPPESREDGGERSVWSHAGGGGAVGAACDGQRRPNTEKAGRQAGAAATLGARTPPHHMPGQDNVVPTFSRSDSLHPTIRHGPRASKRGRGGFRLPTSNRGGHYISLICGPPRKPNAPTHPTKPTETGHRGGRTVQFRIL